MWKGSFMPTFSSFILMLILTMTMGSTPYSPAETPKAPVLVAQLPSIEEVENQVNENVNNRPDAGQPPVPTPVPTQTPPVQIVPPPAPPVPISVAIVGPQRGFIENAIVFHAQITGKVKLIKWKITPEDKNLILQEGDHVAIFTTDEPGDYRITIAVSGETGLEISEHPFELFREVVVEEEEDEPETSKVDEEKPEPMASTPPPPPPAPEPVPTLPEFMLNLVNSVNLPTSTKVSQSHIIAGSFRSVTQRIVTRNFPAKLDPFAEATSQANLALGGGAPAWAPFFLGLAGAVRTARERGELQSNQQCMDALNGIASLLAAMQ